MKRGLIIFFIVLAVILGLPLVAGLKNQLSSSTPQPASKTNTENSGVSSTPTPSVSTPIVPPPQTPQTQYQAPVVPQGPPDFTGTAWSVPTPYGVVQVSLNPGGQAVASHPMVGNITGSWRVQGNKIVATVSYMGNNQTVSADICGNTLCFNGQPLQRLR
ncbi:MAG: hypothetical protein ACP5UA_12020 [Candidatus Hydrogenedens sp.]